MFIELCTRGGAAGLMNNLPADNPQTWDGEEIVRIGRSQSATAGNHYVLDVWY